MGKKVSQTASTKTSKNVVEKQRIHSLIKVLRPKVYITDSSSFKQLVQELTGYRSQTIPKPEDVEKVVRPVIEIEDQGEIQAVTTTTLSMDSSLGSFELCDQAFQLEEINQPTGLIQTAYQDNISMFDHMSNLSTNSNQQTDWLASYRNLESWLLDAEPYYTQHEQEVISLFDHYELLSGLI